MGESKEIKGADESGYYVFNFVISLGKGKDMSEPFDWHGSRVIAAQL